MRCPMAYPPLTIVISTVIIIVVVVVVISLLDSQIIKWKLSTARRSGNSIEIKLKRTKDEVTSRSDFRSCTFVRYTNLHDGLNIRCAECDLCLRKTTRITYARTRVWHLKVLSRYMWAGFLSACQHASREGEKMKEKRERTYPHDVVYMSFSTRAGTIWDFQVSELHTMQRRVSFSKPTPRD